MNAKGMFKKLGYIKEPIENERFISYRKPKGDSFSYIQFDSKDKTYQCYYFDSRGIQPQIIGIKETLAIQKQIDELGWI